MSISQILIASFEANIPPKGTKGAAIDGEIIGNAGTEYEYLLNKNQEYITLNVDENLRIIDILLVN